MRNTLNRPLKTGLHLLLIEEPILNNNDNGWPHGLDNLLQKWPNKPLNILNP